MTRKFSAWARRFRHAPRRVAAAVALLLAIAVAALAAVEFGPASAEYAPVSATPVPAADLPTVVSAALSCPALTPPKLAALVMAASSFDAHAGSTTIPVGIAGMSDADWARWRPDHDAQRTDDQANIVALAHRSCDVIGKLRTAKVSGDLWEASVATEKVGLDAVTKAGAVPSDAKDYVSTVAGYAAWYATQSQFTGATPTGTPAPSGSGSAMAVPDIYVDDVKAAGVICPEVTASEIAAQLMAASGFNASMSGSDGRQGIAQFLPDDWDRFRTSKTATPLDPHAAVRTLGSAMCDLVHQLTLLTGASPYTLALAAFQWGTSAVRAANGVPRGAAVGQLVDQVRAYVTYYESDPRLGKTQPSASASRSTPPSPSPSPSKASPLPSPSPSFVPDKNALYQIENAFMGAILDVPGDDVSTASGVQIQMWQNQRARDQFWRITAAPDKGYYVITNGMSGKSLGIKGSSTDNYSLLVQLDTNTADHNQQWSFRSAGNGQFYIVNRNSGKVLDLNGDDTATGNGYPVEQFSLQTYAKDQKWLFTQ